MSGRSGLPYNSCRAFRLPRRLARKDFTPVVSTSVFSLCSLASGDLTEMLYRVGADLVLCVHLAFVAFAVFGGFLVCCDPGWTWVHISIVLWSSVVNLMSWTCPLTPIEQTLRRRAGASGYSGGFVQHYVGRLVYPRGMPRQLELVAGVSVVVGNVLVYALMFALAGQ